MMVKCVECGIVFFLEKDMPISEVKDLDGFSSLIWNLHIIQYYVLKLVVFEARIFMQSGKV